jgi:hypothetical protein
LRGLAIAALVLLAAPAVAQAQVTRERAVELGAEAYRYGLPLLEFLRVWGEMTSSQRVNSFDHARRFARPQDRTVVAPNVDTLRPRQLPPVRAFWSLTLYDGESYLVPNPAKRYAVGNSHPPLHRRPDGSIVVRIQPERPASRA